MILGILLLIGLITLAMKWQKPILAALIYSIIKTSIQAVFLFVLQKTEHTTIEIIFGMLFGVLGSFLIGWLMTWLLVKFREKTWAMIAAVPLAIILVIL